MQIVFSVFFMHTGSTQRTGSTPIEWGISERIMLIRDTFVYASQDYHRFQGVLEVNREAEFYIPDRLYETTKKDGSENAKYTLERFTRNEDGSIRVP